MWSAILKLQIKTKYIFQTWSFVQIFFCNPNYPPYKFYENIKAACYMRKASKHMPHLCKSSRVLNHADSVQMWPSVRPWLEIYKKVENRRRWGRNSFNVLTNTQRVKADWKKQETRLVKECWIRTGPLRRRSGGRVWVWGGRGVDKGQDRNRRQEKTPVSRAEEERQK